MKLIKSILLLAAAVLAGCAHYQLGDSTERTFSTIGITPITNQSFAPQAQARLHEALYQALSKTAGLKVVEPAQAQAILDVEITRYHKEIGATDRDDTGRARSLDLTLTATATLRDAQGDLMAQQSFTVTDNYYADEGSSMAETQALPLLVTRLANQIASATVSQW